MEEPVDIAQLWAVVEVAAVLASPSVDVAQYVSGDEDGRTDLEDLPEDFRREVEDMLANARPLAS